MVVVTPVACLADNYAWLVVEPESGELAVVDPSDAPPVLAALAALGARPRAIWVTHHHFDHVGGVDELVRRFPDVEVVAHESDRERTPSFGRGLEHGDELRLGGACVRALHVPGHTSGALAYVVDGHAFTGDTLFLGGCGRLFEGTPESMHRSLNVVLGALDGDVEVHCGHEYTLANLRFAAHVEPSNAAVRARIAEAIAARDEGRPTTGTMGDERATNPFLRVRSAEIRATVGVAAEADDVEAFRAIRRAKDTFRAD